MTTVIEYLNQIGVAIRAGTVNSPLCPRLQDAFRRMNLFLFDKFMRSSYNQYPKQDSLLCIFRKLRRKGKELHLTSVFQTDLRNFQTKFRLFPVNWNFPVQIFVGAKIRMPTVKQAFSMHKKVCKNALQHIRCHCLRSFFSKESQLTLIQR